MRSDPASALPTIAPPTRRSLSPNFWTGLLALAGAAVGMSVSPTLVRLADVGPFASAFWRVALALPVLWVWMRQAEESALVKPPTHFSLAALLAGLAFAGDLFFWHLSIMQTSVANATLFATAAPIWVVVFGWLLFRRRVNSAVLTGLGCCVAGGATLVSHSFSFNPAHAIGDVYGIVTGMFFGLYFLAVGAAREKTSAGRVTLQLSLVTTVVLFVVALLFEPRWLPQSPRGWMTLLALALISHVGGQGLLSIALGRLPPVFSSLVIFLEAIVAALIAWIVLGEPVSVVQALGGLIIVAGIWIARPRDTETGH